MEDTIIRTGLRLPYELNTWLVLEARKRGIPKNAFILQILWNWLEHKKENVCMCQIGEKDNAVTRNF